MQKTPSKRERTSEKEKKKIETNKVLSINIVKNKHTFSKPENENHFLIFRSHFENISKTVALALRLAWTTHSVMRENSLWYIS
jgi:hypothetical protein